MIIVHDANEREGREWIATVGFFDGVHCGHRFLMEELLRLADGRGLLTAVFTFPVHPRVVLQAGYQPQLLNSFDEKLEHLSATGVDYCAVLDFTPALAALSAHDFITEILFRQWHVRTLLVGYDHRFGHNRSEGFEQYVTCGAACGMEVLRASSYRQEDGVVSSSKIRRLLSECRVEEAAHRLTYAYRLKGHVVSGYQTGRKLGFPTANIEVDDPFKVWPGMGVYAVWVHLEGVRYQGMLSIGNRPTLNGKQVVIEVHLLHFSGIVYRQRIEVEFIRYLRENRKFDSLDALKTQLSEDRRQVEQLLTGDF
ncbi:MAG: riboflavin biosynthesis protein RibF [Tannerella sp.]|jgi:riboflavin kinase/FMN adenylyltransferase|nr:riboflavin biosynthesis protein RibF [Tannerella sp.]